MFGFMKGFNKPSSDSNTQPAKRAASEPNLVVPNDLDNGHRGGGLSSSASSSPYNSAAAKDRYKNDFRDSGGLENQTTQELENYAVYKSEETTSTVNNCLRIAEDIRDDATRTLDMLHVQGEQINRTHNMVADTEKDLSRGEKILGNLGGMFSKTWKPKKGKEITGPEVTIDTSSKKADKHQREKLGLASLPKGQAASKHSQDQTTAMQKVEMEKAKQDDALSDLSNILGDLKNMAVDMGSELERQNKSLDHLNDDVDELNSRVKGANQRARRLVGK
ncbi:putative SNAP25 homologous protein SNAP30 [Punica granatum]|uniref:t-SNARE coiled-coil homology domain-containing protein n=2 Tax=Punica granatum TaxID=22663 RepID=A0A218XWQ4_PUNGR|nr:putative SNAP25 homologous protein SNAP30 [Punica granatum]XP_031385020.1 putative SNAP25 homologous protein SNAP30 [Punica granatum]XP_031385021.1 putative SNAP25 homologous protein SNAP30 [Punica granatum]XP_031385022.1 putative SNAP25 homologous protein SNAP30 [Punica granatum]OWM89487.1 hypothetical protein CDL15_Pgr024235 [Punica granatum]PKI53332.1 hypothetical protein CRG98_026269 [Punica granatum]